MCIFFYCDISVWSRYLVCDSVCKILGFFISFCFFVSILKYAITRQRYKFFFWIDDRFVCNFFCGFVIWKCFDFECARTQRKCIECIDDETICKKRKIIIIRKNETSFCCCCLVLVWFVVCVYVFFMVITMNQE